MESKRTACSRANGTKAASQQRFVDNNGDDVIEAVSRVGFGAMKERRRGGLPVDPKQRRLKQDCGWNRGC